MEFPIDTLYPYPVVKKEIGMKDGGPQSLMQKIIQWYYQNTFFVTNDVELKLHFCNKNTSGFYVKHFFLGFQVFIESSGEFVRWGLGKT